MIILKPIEFTVFSCRLFCNLLLKYLQTLTTHYEQEPETILYPRLIKKISLDETSVKLPGKSVRKLPTPFLRDNQGFFRRIVPYAHTWKNLSNQPYSITQARGDFSP